MQNRKGMSLADLPTLAIVFVVGFVVLAFGTSIITSVGTGLTGNAALVTGNATNGMLNLAVYAPTIGTVVAGALVIGILVNAFMKQ